MNLATVVSFCSRHTDLFSDEKLSFVCIRTNTPKFLVFGKSPEQPLAVVEHGGELLKQTFEAANKLHQLLPDLVPRPLHLEPSGETAWWTVTAGAPGYPWFALHRRINDIDAWERLVERCLDTLRTFQAAVSKVEAWSGSISPCAELLEQHQICRHRGIIKSERTHQLIEAMTESLQEHDDLTGFAQHGDFCLNNILLGEQTTMLIDYEHFGRTLMPLQDELLLTQSLMRSKPAKLKLSGGDLLARVTNGSRFDGQFSAIQIKALTVHQRLWSLNDFYGQPGRAGRVRELRDELRQLELGD